MTSTGDILDGWSQDKELHMNRKYEYWRARSWSLCNPLWKSTTLWNIYNLPLHTAAPGWLQWKCNNKKEQKASLRQPNSILQEERQNIGHFFEKFVSISEVCFTCVEEMVLTFPPHSVSRHHCGVKFRRVRCAGAADNCLELSKCFSHYDGEL